MTNARDDVLAAVRAALGGEPAETAAPLVRRYRTGEDGPSDPTALLALLEDRLRDYRATVVRCAPHDVPATVAAQLADVASVVHPAGLPDAWVRAIEAAGPAVVADRPDAPLTPAELDRRDAVVTGCRLALAETGSIVLDDGPDQGRRALTLVPDRHVCVVRADQVVRSVPEAVRLLEADPARPMTWVSGPSATSDVELVRVEGVHGPRDLRIVLVEGPVRA